MFPSKRKWEGSLVVWARQFVWDNVTHVFLRGNWSLHLIWTVSKRVKTESELTVCEVQQDHRHHQQAHSTPQTHGWRRVHLQSQKEPGHVRSTMSKSHQWPACELMQNNPVQKSHAKETLETPFCFSMRCTFLDLSFSSSKRWKKPQIHCEKDDYIPLSLTSTVWSFCQSLFHPLNFWSKHMKNLFNVWKHRSHVSVAATCPGSAESKTGVSGCWGWILGRRAGPTCCQLPRGPQLSTVINRLNF